MNTNQSNDQSINKKKKKIKQLSNHHRKSINQSIITAKQAFCSINFKKIRNLMK